MDATLRKHCQTRKAAMLAERSLYERDWQQIADYVDPYAGRFLRKKGGQRALPSRAKILNNSAARACRTMDAGFMGGHTSKSRPWFGVMAPNAQLNELPDVRAWCDDVSQILRDILAKSNFYTALPHFYHSRHLFGVGVMFGDEDKRDVVRWYSRNIGTYALALDGRGICDSVWYEYEESARNIVAEFKDRNPQGVPARVTEAVANNKGDQKFLVQCLVEPNPDRVDGSRVATERPVRHIYWIDGADTDGHGCLCIEGSYEMRALAGRWDATGGDVYGTSPGLESLGDIKQLQYLEGEKLRLIDLMAKPPLALPDAMRNRGASLEPGSKTYLTPTQTQQTVGPLYTPDARGLEQVKQDIEVVKARIEAAFFADLFRMLDFLDDRQRTAYEISERKEEKVAMLSPALESLTDEVLTPAIEMTFASADRAGLIPPVPEALANVALKIEFTSMLAMAQKAAGLGSIERTVGFAAQLFQASGGQLPVWDKIDTDQCIDEFNDRAGGPARIVRSDDDVAAIRDGRAQQQQAQQMAAMAPALKQGADALKSAGEAVPQDGSMLQSLASQFALPA